VVRAAATRGLTHLAITDHERIDGALTARKLAPPELTVIVGEEIRSADCDIIGLYLEEVIPAGLPAADTARLIRDQGGLVGLPHPYDRFRSSGGARLLEAELDELLELVDYIEVFNARLVGSGNHRAAELAARRKLPGAAVSDAHTVFEVAVSYIAVDGPVESAADLRAALPGARLVMSRGSYYARALTPVAKIVQRWRGNPRRRGDGAPSSTPTPTTSR
jgi:predicted metal-dependent phosphoesterase TrpH